MVFIFSLFSSDIRYFLVIIQFLFIFQYDSGDTDAVLPVTSTRYSIDALKLPTLRPWSAWYDDGEVMDIQMIVFFPDHWLIDLVIVYFSLQLITILC